MTVTTAFCNDLNYRSVTNANSVLGLWLSGTYNIFKYLDV